ncbi:MAG: 3-oxoadipyl-CoA thiolase [Bdellovibrionales bacterium]|nr:3-oxoadipyl-CoA thiolase [Bdellovibrionales bacterium]
MKGAYLVDGVRTAIGSFGGTLSSVRPDDMAAFVLAQTLERSNLADRTQLEEVILGCANQAGEDNRNVARMALLLAGIPQTVAGETVNRLCASGMSAVIRAADAIGCNKGELFLAGGVESMTRAPFVLAKNDQPWGRNTELFDTSIGWRFVNPKMHSEYGTDSMGQTAENLVAKYSISRGDQDAFALASQQKARRAIESGRLQKEIAPLSIPQRKGDPKLFERDEFPRFDSSLEALSKLRPAFKKDGTVTAGNSSGINDGACALLVASQDALQKNGLRPMARIVSSAVSGVEPRIMGIGPVEASRKALERAGLSLSDMNLIELNEAFAAQSLACLRELGIADDDERVNPNGGAIALGHPLGMSGARLLLTAMYELKERNAQYALCTLCVGVGQGMATIIERCA